TMSCTCLCSSGSTLMRLTSPCTRIMGGRPAERCRSDALFLTEKASSCVISIEGRLSSGDYVEHLREVTTSQRAHCLGLCGRATRRAKRHAAGCKQNLRLGRGA